MRYLNNKFTVAALLISFALPTTTALAENSFSSAVDAKGNISLPKDFRNTMIHLGSWYVPEGEASGFHDVYADELAVSGYRRTGSFPDGTVLVKELRPAKTGDYTTGKNVSYASSESIKQWFVLVKDAKGRFKQNPIWGNGWGWALFKPDNPRKNVATNFEKDCIGCHIPAKSNDWIYVEGYPTLRKPQ